MHGNESSSIFRSSTNIYCCSLLLLLDFQFGRVFILGLIVLQSTVGRDVFILSESLPSILFIIHLTVGCFIYDRIVSYRYCCCCCWIWVVSDFVGVCYSSGNNAVILPPTVVLESVCGFGCDTR